MSLVAVFLTGGGILQAASIIDGSFESPLVPAGGGTSFGNGSTLIPGWTVLGNQVTLLSTSFTQFGVSFPAQDGNQWLDLTGVSSNLNEGVEQTVATNPGTQYTLSFWVGNINNPGGIFGTTSTVNVRLGGPGGTLLGAFTNSLSTPVNTQTWQQFTTTFIAPGSSTTLDFLNGDSTADNSNGLDNVELTESATSVPEPSTLSLLALGTISLGVLRRRKMH
jgi:hypothetical protein